MIFYTLKTELVWNFTSNYETHERYYKILYRVGTNWQHNQVRDPDNVLAVLPIFYNQYLAFQYNDLASSISIRSIIKIPYLKKNIYAQIM